MASIKLTTNVQGNYLTIDLNRFPKPVIANVIELKNGPLRNSSDGKQLVEGGKQFIAKVISNTSQAYE